MKLFCPGPVMVSKEVKDAMINTSMGHRSKEFEIMFKRLKNNILKLVNAPSTYETVILSSSGSSANEAIIASLFTKEDNILILSNGSFGERIADLMDIYQLNYSILKNNWGELFDIDEVESYLQSTHFNYLFISHDETSSGLLNPIEKIGKLCKRYNTEFFVDCVSSLASDEVDIEKQNISIMTSVSGKCIGAIPGASFIVMKENLFKISKTNKASSSYLNLSNYYTFSKEKDQTPNTPNITSFIALDIALKECIREDKASRYLECSNYLRDEFERLNIEFIIDRKNMSNTVTTIIIPKPYLAKDVYDKLYQKGYTTYLTRGIFNTKNCLQICVMGDIYISDCIEFINVFKLIVK